ncbi:hypothetical protein D0809_22705 [Flavobacterium circumlabens]|uniref:Uncharacterized protein n=1 Tax=Flavobacterium circumlabens TaxID=2133765 RepID=A0A4Y7U6L8_9FLAO|nr:hypothetical protein D0809_22705 [Flavobacterium circumlabens]
MEVEILLSAAADKRLERTAGLSSLLRTNFLNTKFQKLRLRSAGKNNSYIPNMYKKQTRQVLKTCRGVEPKSYLIYKSLFILHGFKIENFKN